MHFYFTQSLQFKTMQYIVLEKHKKDFFSIIFSYSHEYCVHNATTNTGGIKVNISVISYNNI